MAGDKRWMIESHVKPAGGSGSIHGTSDFMAKMAAAMGKAPKPPKPPDPALPGPDGDDWVSVPDFSALAGRFVVHPMQIQQNKFAMPNPFASQGSLLVSTAVHGQTFHRAGEADLPGTLPIIGSTGLAIYGGSEYDPRGYLTLNTPMNPGTIPPIGIDPNDRRSMSEDGVYSQDGALGLQFGLGVPPPGWGISGWDCWSPAFWDYLIGQLRRLKDASQAEDASWHIADMIRRCPRGWVTRVLKNERDTTADKATKDAIDLLLNEDFPCRWALNELRQVRTNLKLASAPDRGAWRFKQQILVALHVLYEYNCYDVTSDSHNTSEAAFLKNAIKEIENEDQGWTSHGYEWIDKAIDKIAALKGEKDEREKKKGK